MAADPALTWLIVAIGGLLVAGVGLLVGRSRGRLLRRRRSDNDERQRAEQVTVTGRAQHAARSPSAAATQRAYADPEQMLRLNAVRDAARSLDAGSHRLQQASVRTMTAMMRLRRALAARDAPLRDQPPAWMLRRPEPNADDAGAPSEDRRVVQLTR